MGLFDQFMNLSPDQNQGLLAAAAQMLQASGPSLMPHSFGQVLGQGLQGYQAGQSSAQEAAYKKAMQEQAQALTGLKIQDAQSDFKNQEMVRARQAQIQAELMGGGGVNPAASAAPGAPAAYAPAMPGGAGSPKIGGPDWMRAYQQSPGAEAAPQAAPQAAQEENIRTQAAARLMHEAQVYQKYGDFDSANKRYEAAVKLQPKYATEFRQAMGPDGKLHNYLVAEDGTMKEAGVGVKPDMKQVSLGDRVVFADGNAISDGQSFKMGQSPDSKASNALGWANYNLSKDNAQKPTFNADAGGFVYAPNKANPSGDFKPLAGFDKGKAPTEFQGKSAAFALRAGEANKTIGELTGKYSPAAINSKQTVENTWLVGGALGAATNKFALSEKDQKAEQAQRDFVNAVLRQESGAAIGASEFDNARKQYFQQPGDTAGVIEQKARNRALAVQSLTANAGRAALTAPPRATATNGWSITKVVE